MSLETCYNLRVRNESHLGSSSRSGWWWGMQGEEGSSEEVQKPLRPMALPRGSSRVLSLGCKMG